MMQLSLRNYFFIQLYSSLIFFIRLSCQCLNHSSLLCYRNVFVKECQANKNLTEVPEMSPKAFQRSTANRIVDSFVFHKGLKQFKVIVRSRGRNLTQVPRLQIQSDCENIELAETVELLSC